MEDNLIECNPQKCFGQPSLKGRRLTVYDIVSKAYYEDDIEVIVRDFELKFVEVIAAANYCKNLKCKRDKDLIKFCDGCLLRTLQDGWNFNRGDYLEVIKHGETYSISKDNSSIFLGTIDELENDEFGKITWLLAEEVCNKI